MMGLKRYNSKQEKPMLQYTNYRKRHFWIWFRILSTVLLCTLCLGTQNLLATEFFTEELNERFPPANDLNEALQNISEEDLKIIKADAEAGDTISMLFLGRVYLMGAGVKQDTEAGLKWIRKSASLGDYEAIHLLARFYLNGSIVEQDIPHAMELLKDSYAKGNILAMVDLGILYEYGIGVAQDIGQAINHYITASKGRESSFIDIAYEAFDKGKMQHAMYFFRLSIGFDDSHRAEAMQRIGEFHKEGKIIPRNNILAYVWFSLAQKLTSSSDLALKIKSEARNLSRILSDDERQIANRLIMGAMNSLHKNSVSSP
jgi:TPR repeat protein